MKKITIMLTLLVCLSFAVFADGYKVMVGSGDDAIPVVVVGGTPYEMGYALGSLMKNEVNQLLGRFLGGAQMSEPDKYSDEKLDAAWDAISPYTSKRFVDEMKGLAAGAGISYDTVRRAHMIPVVSEYACSGAALWGQATRNGDFYQFRNLDYTMDGGLQDFPAVVIYVPSSGNAHVNVSFAGYIGVNTGMNVKGICLTEMGDSPGSEYPYDLDGVHFTTLFRDILYDANNLDEAINMIQNAKRIKKYHYIIGDGKSKRAVKMLAHAPNLTIWHDNDPTDEVAPNIKPCVVYNCEGRDPIGWAHIKKYYGKYDPEAMIQLSEAVGSLGGNLLDVVYDGTNFELWVSYAHKEECAFRRAYIHIDAKKYLDPETPPAGVKIFKNKDLIKKVR